MVQSTEGNGVEGEWVVWWLGKREEGGMPVTGQTQLPGHELLPNTFL